jgi:hypothetical protein
MFNGLSLEQYRFIFMAELLSAEILFCSRLRHRRLFLIRLLIVIAFCSLFAFVLPILSYDSVFQAGYFFLLFSFTVGCLFFLYQVDWTIIVFFAIASYTCQHLAYQLFQLIVVAFDLNGGAALSLYTPPGVNPFTTSPFLPLFILLYVDTYFLFYLAAFLIFIKKYKRNQSFIVESKQLLIFISFVLVTDILLSSLLTGRSYESYDRVYICLFHSSNIVCCLLALTFQFRLIKENELQKDLSIANQLLHQKQEQYETSKETIGLINLKVHDLKHQIHEFGNKKAISPETIHDIEGIVNIYDSGVKTGNEALDIILTEKSLFCNKNGIQLTCIVDGSKLSFISDSDLYSLFGNAIDNAVEAVLALPPDKRVIGLIVRQVESFVSVNIHNYYEGNIEFGDNGLPKTTKGDKAYHGFGVQSIKMVADKYHGDVHIDVKNNIFNLDVLFPFTQENAKKQ